MKGQRTPPFRKEISASITRQGTVAYTSFPASYELAMNMDADQVRAWLLAHQPLEEDCTQRELDELREVITYIRNDRDPEWVPLLFRVTGHGNGEGLFEWIEDVVFEAPDDVVSECVWEAVKSEHPGRRAWGITLSVWLDDRHSVMEIFFRSAQSSDIEEQYAAAIAIDIEATENDLPELEAVLATLDDKSPIKELLRETADRLRGELP